MKGEGFERLPLWHAAMELAADAHAFTDHPLFHPRDSLRNQIEEAAVSISDSIAEGFERRTRQELIAFLFLARGSASELRCVLRSLEEDPGFASLQAETLHLKWKAESMAERLRQWSRTLRISNRTARPTPAPQTRKAYLEARRRREFLYELDQMRTAGESRALYGESVAWVAEPCVFAPWREIVFFFTGSLSVEQFSTTLIWRSRAPGPGSK